MKKNNQFMLSKILMVIATVIFLSCDSGSKSSSDEAETTPDFQISLAQWSLHRTFFGGPPDWESFGKTLLESPDSLLQGEDPMNFPAMAAGYGVNSIELVNVFYYSRADDDAYWTEFKQKCDDAGVTVGLIMCDRLGNLGDADTDTRMAAVENHYKWVDIAKFLGAHSIRVNAAGSGTMEEVAANAVDGLSKLGEYGASKGINIIVENHGDYSSDGTWLTGVMKEVGMDNVGTLPDFGNFCVKGSNNPYGECQDMYDRYTGIGELMPFAKGVSAKSHEFDENGNEVFSDFLRIMKIVKESGFKGYVGIEYEGSQLSEDEGIKATKALLEKVFKEI
jgi:sugar phosphate isomerase/epimerase